MQCWHVRFEDCRPSRAFPVYRGQKNFTGWWWTSTTDTHVGYESWLERAVLIGLDFDSDVVGISSQPFWLHWFDGTQPRRHAPDYFVRRADGSADVVDVRPRHRRTRPRARTRRMCPRTRPSPRSFLSVCSTRSRIRGGSDEFRAPVAHRARRRSGTAVDHEGGLAELRRTALQDAPAAVAPAVA
ncbi:TnsA-like heteromeric transposase endonuclease subunit [Streptomyces sp. NBC_01643]|uniref:TnsA-like heteromeric transposase endonuclease subunit n=1 Tax=Streptomyces sp. NBC_01643 TaxID=2975906 RepID=UPI002F91A8A9